jgi:endonuclease/exonuclease/phosphatase family metal-dependent hydrolase
VLDCDGRDLHVDVVHPSPTISEAERVEAFLPLLASAGRPYLLLGDFNSLSDEDGYDHATLVEELRGNVAEPEALAARMLDRQLVAAVRAHGLVDTLAPAARTHTLPTGLLRPGATQGARLRIDYIFASPELAVQGAEVIRTPATERASDHYPVVARLTL